MRRVKRCKCVLIGEAAVGKTSIVKSLMGKPHAFPLNYNMTCGVEIFCKSLRAESTENILEFFIYDFSGKQMYADLVKKIWSNNVTVIVGVFDVTNESSFFSLQSSLTQLLKEISRPEEVVGIILGNKNDLSHRRCVSIDDANQLAKKYKMRYFDVSAKEDPTVIEEAFMHVTSMWMDHHQDASIGGSNNNAAAKNKRRSFSTSRPPLVHSNSHNHNNSLDNRIQQ